MYYLGESSSQTHSGSDSCYFKSAHCVMRLYRSPSMSCHNQNSNSPRTDCDSFLESPRMLKILILPMKSGELSAKYSRAINIQNEARKQCILHSRGSTEGERGRRGDEPGGGDWRAGRREARNDSQLFTALVFGSAAVHPLQCVSSRTYHTTYCNPASSKGAVRQRVGGRKGLKMSRGKFPQTHSLSVRVSILCVSV